MKESTIYPQVIKNSSSMLGEGLYVNKFGIFWLDILSCKLFIQENCGSLMVFILPEQASCILKVCGETIYLVSESGICTYNFQKSMWKVIVEISFGQSKKSMRANDGCVVQEYDNYFFFGTMQKNPNGKHGSLYMVRGSEFFEVYQGIGIPNTFVQLSKYSFLVSDSWSKVIYLITFESTYTEIVECRIWLDLSSSEMIPDGGCVDEGGNIYIAMWDGFCIRKYDSEANLLAEYPLPIPRPTNCKFSLDREYLIVTSAKEGLSEEQLLSCPHSGFVFRYRLVN